MGVEVGIVEESGLEEGEVVPDGSIVNIVDVVSFWLVASKTVSVTLSFVDFSVESITLEL